MGGRAVQRGRGARSVLTSERRRGTRMRAAWMRERPPNGLEIKSRREEGAVVWRGSGVARNGRRDGVASWAEEDLATQFSSEVAQKQRRK
eukprot:487530-Pleurochrysis_carterae.AAC.3